jgi:hypothetical protein
MRCLSGILGGAFLLHAACAKPQRETGPTLTTRLLPNGAAITIINHAERADYRGRAWFVDYLTKLPIRDRQALAPEVDEIWCSFKADAEKSRITTVFIIPNDAPIGGELTSFSFKQQPDGTWLRQGQRVSPCE